MKIFRRNLSKTNITSIMTKIKTFIFVDLETTGLPQFENNKTKITELCAVAVQADHIELGVFPRVQNKLSLCFNPGKALKPEASEITGLTNELLEDLPEFSSNTVDLINNWLEIQRKPLCFAAHNGNRFDYPILKAEVHKAGGNQLPDDILCVDTLLAFRCLDQEQEEEKKEQEASDCNFDDDMDDALLQCVEEYEQGLTAAEMQQKRNETTPKKQMIPTADKRAAAASQKKLNFRVSYKLGDIYKRLTNKQVKNAHEAGADVEMMITCAAVYGERFVNYANDNATSLADIPMMKVGENIINKS